MRSKREQELLETEKRHNVVLPDFGIPGWALAPVEVELGINLYREDLCCSDAFGEHFGVSTLDGALIHFMTLDAFYTPLYYRFHSPLAGLTYEAYAVDNFQRKTQLEIKERRKIGGAAPWDREIDYTLFELFIGPPPGYRRMLRVGGARPELAKVNWDIAAGYLRKRIGELRKAGQIQPRPDWFK